MSLEQLIHSPDHSPNFTHDFCHSVRASFSENLEQDILAIFYNSPEIRQQFNHACLCSRFFCNEVTRNADLIKTLVGELNVHAVFKKEYYEKKITPTDACISEDDFNSTLRQWRTAFMLRIIWRDANRVAQLQHTTHELSYLAEVTLQLAINFHSNVLQSRFGTPRNKAKEEQAFIVLGMGKLGARELNLSSDIDLIFCFPDNGYTDGEDSIENQNYFIKLGKKVIQSLDTITAEGRVFRVDMRLRPYGQSGSLVYHYRALEEYYQSQGREWERYAMVKARIVASSGDNYRHAELVTILKNFTFRTYIDFSVIEALRKLKKIIRQEVQRRNLRDDVKLSAGGIREIEFIAQVFQLIRGGRDKELQDNRVSIVIPLLEKLHCLPSDVTNDLLDAYTFLRNTEHAIQAFNDEQSQKIPIDAVAKNALTAYMQCASWKDFTHKLNTHRHKVAAAFENTIGYEDDSETPVDYSKSALALWLSVCAENSPDHIRIANPALLEFAQSPTVKRLTAESRERLDQFIPILLTQLEENTFSPGTINRVLPLIRAVIRRSAYLVLLIENPPALRNLLELVQASQQIADQLTRHPALLDELLDTENLYSLPEKADLLNELQRIMLRIEETDLEKQMEALRYFKLSHTLRIEACEISGALPLMRVSDYLTFLAEAILEYCLNLIWHIMVARHGYPDDIESEEPQFLIVGYGKLGGIEMNHGSDLDLVFIHNASIAGYTNGERRIESQAFYARLGQKLIHILNTQTASGRLYEVDMRLRPSGNAGLLATTLSAFEKYQKNDAWTWEHQALVRARPIAGSQELTNNFNDLRLQLLCQQRDINKLQAEIVQMRNKMRDHLGSHTHEATVFHIKQDAGGIVDIEFMVQYLVLAWSHAHPALATYTDNIRILETLAQTDKLSTQEVEQLIASYKALRVITHRLTMEQASSLIDNNELRAERDSVIQIWHRLFNTMQAVN